jgi:hypothetical protein
MEESADKNDGDCREKITSLASFDGYFTAAGTAKYFYSCRAVS